MSGWTEERRRKQAEIIRRHKPWEKSTGPRTEKGKQRSSINAYKHGERCRFLDEYSRLFRINQLFLDQLKRTVDADEETLIKTNELRAHRQKTSHNK